MSNVDVGQVIGELKEFIDVLNKLKSMNGIKCVEISVVELPLGRKFSYLNDGITRRRCVIGKVVTIDGKEHSLIEVEREGRSLSMLIITPNGQVDCQWVYRQLLHGLVKESGKWSKEVFASLEKQYIIKRHRHLDKILDEKVLDIYLKISSRERM